MVKFVVMWEVSRRPKNQNKFKQQCRNKDLLLYYFWDRHTFCYFLTIKKISLYAKNFFVSGRISAQIVLKPSPWPGDSKSVLRVEIG